MVKLPLPLNQAVIIPVFSAGHRIGLAPDTDFIVLHLFQLPDFTVRAPALHVLLQHLPTDTAFRPYKPEGFFHGFIHIKDFICFYIRYIEIGVHLVQNSCQE